MGSNPTLGTMLDHRIKAVIRYFFACRNIETIMPGWRNCHTRQIESLVSAGSNPAPGTTHYSAQGSGYSLPESIGPALLSVYE